MNKYTTIFPKSVILVATIFSLFALGSIFTRCYYNSEEELYISVTDNCDLSNVTYSSSVEPILQESCLGCHGTSYDSNGGGIDLRTYANAKSRIDGIIGSTSGDPDYEEMPKNSAPLSDCKISVFQTWKSNGFPQN